MSFRSGSGFIPKARAMPTDRAPAAILAPTRCCVECRLERPRHAFAYRARRCDRCNARREPPKPLPILPP